MGPLACLRRGRPFMEFREQGSFDCPELFRDPVLVLVRQVHQSTSLILTLGVSKRYDSPYGARIVTRA